MDKQNNWSHDTSQVLMTVINKIHHIFSLYDNIEEEAKRAGNNLEDFSFTKQSIQHNANALAELESWLEQLPILAQKKAESQLKNVEEEIKEAKAELEELKRKSTDKEKSQLSQKLADKLALIKEKETERLTALKKSYEQEKEKLEALFEFNMNSLKKQHKNVLAITDQLQREQLSHASFEKSMSLQFAKFMENSLHVDTTEEFEDEWQNYNQQTPPAYHSDKEQSAESVEANGENLQEDINSPSWLRQVIGSVVPLVQFWESKNTKQKTKPEEFSQTEEREDYYDKWFERFQKYARKIPSRSYILFMIGMGFFLILGEIYLTKEFTNRNFDVSGTNDGMGTIFFTVGLSLLLGMVFKLVIISARKPRERVRSFARMSIVLAIVLAASLAQINSTQLKELTPGKDRLKSEVQSEPNPLQEVIYDWQIVPKFLSLFCFTMLFSMVSGTMIGIGWESYNEYKLIYGQNFMGNKTKRIERLQKKINALHKEIKVQYSNILLSTKEHEENKHQMLKTYHDQVNACLAMFEQERTKEDSEVKSKIEEMDTKFEVDREKLQSRLQELRVQRSELEVYADSELLSSKVDTRKVIQELGLAIQAKAAAAYERGFRKRLSGLSVEELLEYQRSEEVTQGFISLLNTRVRSFYPPHFNTENISRSA